MMNKSKLKLIARQAGELKEIILRFDAQQDMIRQIDLDLLLDKVRRIYENILLLNLDTSNEDKLEERQSLHGIEKEESLPAVTLSQTQSIVEQPEEKNANQTNDFSEKKPALSIIDLFPAKSDHEKSQVKKSLVEKIAEEKPVEILAEKIGKKKIPGLNQAIGINEKFFFINELFDGNMKNYKEAIEKLDHIDDLQNAKEYIESLAELYKWDKTKEAVTVLLDFVERKFN